MDDETYEDQYGWQDTQGNSLMLHRRWPIDGDLNAIEERFLGRAMNVTKAELACVGQTPVELSLREAEQLAIEIGLAAWEGGIDLDGDSQITMRAVSIDPGGFDFETPPFVVDPETNPMHRACDKDRSIPMG